MMEPSGGKSRMVKFFPAIYLLAQEVPKLRAVPDTPRPAASCLIVLTQCPGRVGTGHLTHAHNSHRLMLVGLQRSHTELKVIRLAKKLSAVEEQNSNADRHFLWSCNLEILVDWHK